MTVLTTLRDRGFIYQTTHDQELEQHLQKSCTFYVGFDPTADSLHVGSLVPIMAMAHMQAAGHHPIAILGGGTARVGDPSGKTEMRQMLEDGTIEANEKGIAEQLNRYLELDGKQGSIQNNKDWLIELRYIDFLRDIGVHFSINRMLTAESVKSRLETGLSFIEFNYMLLQAYDFYILAKNYNCTLQMGGQDQWGNIVAGMDLCRRMGEDQQAFGATFPLVTNSNGAKFGKSEKGNIWLDEARTPIFDFYQFWRNVEDSDVKRFLLLFTFLPVAEIERLIEENINRAKEILGFEVTRLCHGNESAKKAFSTAAVRFGQADEGGQVKTSSGIASVNVKEHLNTPSISVPMADIKQMTWTQLLVLADLAQSNSEARRLVRGGGAKVDDQALQEADELVSVASIARGEFLLRAGKKRMKLVKIVS